MGSRGDCMLHSRWYLGEYLTVNEPLRIRVREAETASRNWMHQRGTIPFEAIDAVHAGSTTLVNQRVEAETAAIPRTRQEAFSSAAALEVITSPRPLFREGPAPRKL